MNASNKKENPIGLLAECIGQELRTIARSRPILLVMIGGVVFYGLLYNYMYAPNLVRRAPVAVVDLSHTPLSREFIRLFAAAPQVEVCARPADMLGARELMKRNRTVGILYLPADFEKRAGRGEQALFAAFGNTGTFLDFAAVQTAAAGAMREIGAQLRPDMVRRLGPEALYAVAQAPTAEAVGTVLFNPTEGYGSYLIPAVLMLILFQTLLMVIGSLAGGERHDGSILRHGRYGTGLGAMARIVAGKALAYCAVYAVFAYFLLGLLPEAFDIPAIGRWWELALLIVPYLLATSFFGLTGALFFTDSESPVLMIPFFSVGLIFLSGVSYPLELIPWYWRAAHYALPAAPGVLAYVKINSMGASLYDIRREYIVLWAQCAVYFLTACAVLRHNIRKARRSMPRTADPAPAARTCGAEEH